jgi:hypothetical protein
MHHPTGRNEYLRAWARSRAERFDVRAWLIAGALWLSYIGVVCLVDSAPW